MLDHPLNPFLKKLFVRPTAIGSAEVDIGAAAEARGLPAEKLAMEPPPPPGLGRTILSYLACSGFQGLGVH